MATGELPALLGPGLLQAQATLYQWQTALVSAWLVTIDGESKTRTLRIKGFSQEADQSLLLDAEFGHSDRKQSTAKAEIVQVGQDRQLKLITPSDSIIVATQLPNGSFAGTFTQEPGVPKGVLIEKISDDDLQKFIQGKATSKGSGQEFQIQLDGLSVPAAS